MKNRIKILIIGKNPDYFLKELIRNRKDIYYIKREKHKLEIIISYLDYLKLLEKKTTYKIVILDRYGKNKYINLLKKYMYLLLFSIFGIILNLFLSNIIFDVEINHPNKKLVSQLRKDLEQEGLKKYHLKISYSEREKLKEKILNKEKDLIEWLEIEENGTSYLIKVEERKKNLDSDVCNPRHIVSKKNALILKIISSDGEVVKKKNDYVEKGEVIVSGLIHNKDLVVSKKCSVGQVFGEVWYTVKVIISKKYENDIVLNTKCYGLSFSLLDKKVDLFNKFRNYKKNEYNIINDDNIIPVKIGLTGYYKVKKEYKINKIDDVLDDTIELSTKTLQKKLSPSSVILDKKVLKKKENNSKIEIDVFFKVMEDITDYFDISNIDILEMNKKEE